MKSIVVLLFLVACASPHEEGSGSGADEDMMPSSGLLHPIPSPKFTLSLSPSQSSSSPQPSSSVPAISSTSSATLLMPFSTHVPSTSESLSSSLSTFISSSPQPPQSSPSSSFIHKLESSLFFSSPTPSVLPARTTSSATTPTPISNSTTSPPSIPSFPLNMVIAVVVVVVVIVAVVLIVLCLICIVVKRRKKSRYILETAGADRYFTFQAGESKHTEEVDVFSEPDKRASEIINYEATTFTNTFGIFSNPTSPTNTSAKSQGKPPEDEGSLPALIFLSAVDPSIPVISNTLPTRKIKKMESIITSSEAPEMRCNSEDSLKPSKSTGAINKDSAEDLLTSQSLGKMLQLSDLTKQKVNEKQNFVYDASKLTENSTNSADTGHKVQGNDGYVFMEPIDRSTRAEVHSQEFSITTFQNSKPTTKVNSSTRAEKSSFEAESSFSVSVDTSHYDVPRKLLKAQTSSGAVQKPDDVQTPKAPEKMSIMTGVPLKVGTESKIVSKPEGIYDVPRSILKQVTETSPSSLEGKSETQINKSELKSADSASNELEESYKSSTFHSIEKTTEINPGVVNTCSPDGPTASASSPEDSTARMALKNLTLDTNFGKGNDQLAKGSNQANSNVSGVTSPPSVDEKDNNGSGGEVKTKPRLMPKPKKTSLGTPINGTETAPINGTETAEAEGDGTKEKPTPLPRSKKSQKRSTHQPLMPGNIFQELRDKRVLIQNKEVENTP